LRPALALLSAQTKCEMSKLAVVNGLLQAVQKDILRLSRAEKLCFLQKRGNRPLLWPGSYTFALFIAKHPSKGHPDSLMPQICSSLFSTRFAIELDS